MSAVFLDTVRLLAVLNTADQWHLAASAAYTQIRKNRRKLVTTTFILLECGNAAARKPIRGHVCRLHEKLEQRQEIIVPLENDWREAWEAYERGEAGNAGIVEHDSFVIMRRLGITEAFTNDRHFQAAGFSVLF